MVEADGSAGRPLKAHRPWEPVIPACSDLTVCVNGASGIGRPAAEVCHCSELFCALAGTSPDAPVQVEDIARVIAENEVSISNIAVYKGTRGIEIVVIINGYKDIADKLEEAGYDVTGVIKLKQKF